MSIITQLRKEFHEQVCLDAVFLKKQNVPSIADGSSKLSVYLSQSIIAQLDCPVSAKNISGQTAGANFERAVKDYLESAISTLSHLRPAQWIYAVQTDLSRYIQYRHLSEINAIVKENKELRTALGDYFVKPDVTVARMPATDEEINRQQIIVDAEGIPTLTPMRQGNQENLIPILHASISCKLTLRSDRSQNARTEALNLIRNRKGHAPHIAVITAEPMPSRLASLAFGTGDIDCVYHFALHELAKAVATTKNEAAIDSLDVMIDGDRLRDISDLPFDLLS